MNEGIYQQAGDGAIQIARARDVIIEKQRRFVVEEHLVTQWEIERLGRVYVRPQPDEIWNAALKHLEENRFLLITGPMGIGKRSLALSLAQHLNVSQIVRISRLNYLEDLGKVEDSMILVGDPFGLLEFDESDVREIEAHFDLVEKLCAENNYVVVTSDLEIFNEVCRQTRLLERPLVRCRIELGGTNYHENERLRMLEKHIDYALSERRISDKQEQWISQSLRKIARELEVPLHIWRLVEVELPQIEGERQLSGAIARASDIQRAIREWFLHLDNSQQCFVFTLAIFNRLQQQSIQRMYKEVALRLRELDPTISVRPPGVLRTNLVPYVTDQGDLEFSQPQYREYLLKIIAQRYRMYFLELVPTLFRGIALPPDDAPNWLIDQTRAMRIAVALATGVFAQYGFDDELLALIEDWASHPKGRVSSAAGIAFSKVAEDKTRRGEVLARLRNWIHDFSEGGRYKRWAASAALWRIGQLEPYCVLEDLEFLANDPDDYVHSSVPYALKRISRTSAKGIMPILTRLARYQDERTRQEVANAADEIGRDHRQMMLRTVKEWGYSNDPDLHYMAVLTMLMVSRFTFEDRVTLVRDVIGQDSQLLGEVWLAALQAEGGDVDRVHRFVEQMVIGEHLSKGVVTFALCDAYKRAPDIMQSIVELWKRSDEDCLRRIAFRFRILAACDACRRVIQVLWVLYRWLQRPS